MEQPLNIRLHVISPVHIGCDDVYEPTSFVIDERKKKLVEFDPMEFIENLTPPEREQFSAICSRDDLLKIFQFIKKHYRHGHSINEIGISAGLIVHYQKVLSMSSYNKNTIINQFTMNKTAYNPQTNRAYIPGSSLKGSLKTGYLSSMAVNNGIKDTRNPKALESGLLGGSFASDPFRMIKVSDFQPLEGVHTRIIYAVNRKKRKSDRPTKAENGPPQIFEAIEPGSVFEGIINVAKPIKTASIKVPIEKEALFKAIQRHYKKVYDHEIHVVNDCGFRRVEIDGFKERIGSDCFLVRLGRHSGAEAVTIEGNRNIKIMQGQREPAEYSKSGSTTVWLASETSKPTVTNTLMPFGWAVLELEPFDDSLIKPIFTPEEQAPDSQLFVEPIQNMPPITVHKEAERTLWKNVTIIWKPNNQTLLATFEGKRAEAKIGTDKSFVPERFHKKLYEKHKSINGDIIVELIGGNVFRIICFAEE